MTDTGLTPVSVMMMTQLALRRKMLHRIRLPVLISLELCKAAECRVLSAALV